MIIISRKLIRNICSDNNNNNVANINIYKVIYILYMFKKIIIFILHV